MLLRVLAVVAAVLSACVKVPEQFRTPFLVDQHPRIMEIEPPREYRIWWGEMEDCTKLRRRMAGVRFFVVEGDGFTVAGLTDTLWGVYDPKRSWVYVAQTQMFLRETVAHEMIHALGIYGHPRFWFEAHCGIPVGRQGT